MIIVNNCSQCKYCFKAKQRMNSGVYKTASICCALPITEGVTSGYEAFALVVDKDRDTCEMFTERVLNKNGV